VIAWALRHPADADRNADLHALLGLDLYLAARRNAGLWPNDPTEPVLSADERKQATKLFGRRGTAYWTGHRASYANSSTSTRANLKTRTRWPKFRPSSR
jgi:hypothetical protein